MVNFTQGEISEKIAIWSNKYDYLIIGLLVLAVIFTELLLEIGFASTAVWCYLELVFIFVFFSYYNNKDELLYPVFAMIPLFRLVNLGMPTFSLKTLYWLPLVYGALIPSIYILIISGEVISSSTNRKRLLLFSAPAVLLGGVLSALEYTLTQSDPLITALSIQQVLLLSVIMFVIVSPVEELIFRGMIQERLQSRFGRKAGIGLTAILFGTMHSTSLLGSSIWFGISLGIVLGVIYNRTASLGTVIIIHGSLNTFLYGLYPFVKIL
jgi:membrane protease YdiL (CAAX protease family)